MTGPEHYREAERLLEHANRVAQQDGEPRQGHKFAEVVAEAQVHATLALVAAQVDICPPVGCNKDEWETVASPFL